LNRDTRLRKTAISFAIRQNLFLSKGLQYEEAFMQKIFFIVVSFVLLACASATQKQPTDQAAAPQVQAPSTAADPAAATAEEVVTCRTPDVMDAGYQVRLTSDSETSYRGTLTTTAIWGASAPLYDGTFAVTVLPKAGTKRCFAQLKGDPAGVRSKNIKDLIIHAEGDSGRSTMSLKAGAPNETLACKLPKSLSESIQRCQAAL
jgi:hypothetical protein